jgi:hypothetical protein
MQCLVCGADMQLTRVVNDETMPVAGFAHRLLTCPVCGETERRLEFKQVEMVPTESIPAPPPTCIPDEPDPLPACIPDEPAPPPKLGAWAQAVERIRQRQEMLAQRKKETAIAPQAAMQAPPLPRAVESAAASGPSIGDEFDRLWESLGRAPAEPSQREVERPIALPAMSALPPAPARDEEVSDPPLAPAEPAAQVPSECSTATGIATAAPNSITAKQTANPWGRAIAMFRARRSTSQPRRSNAMLRLGEEAIPHLDDEALTALPLRQQQRRE